MELPVKQPLMQNYDKDIRPWIGYGRITATFGEGRVRQIYLMTVDHTVNKKMKLNNNVHK